MKLSIPHNWQNDLIDSLRLRDVDEFYGKSDSDIFGGGRSSNISPYVSKKTMQEEIQRIHKKGCRFNYLLNSTCLDNQELSGPFQKKISKFLDSLTKISVDSVTVSLVCVLKVIKKDFPQLKINVSTMAQVDTPDKAKFWEDLGAEKITLYEVNVNRNFGLLEKIRKATNCKLQLIANNGCLYECPFTVNHGLLCSHASQKNHASRGFIIDFYRIFCSYLRIKDPVNFIRADWIRPEDIRYYEDLGIDSIKLVNRGMATDALKKIVNAYSNRAYEGNLMDIFPSPSKNINFIKRNPWYIFSYFFHPRLINLFKLTKIRNMFDYLEKDVYVDNMKLNGFLLSLKDKNCNLDLCDNCLWCKKIADKAVTVKVDPKSIKKIEDVIADFISGKLFRY
jgi:collagenase-like PrtC family protease